MSRVADFLPSDSGLCREIRALLVLANAKEGKEGKEEGGTGIGPGTGYGQGQGQEEGKEEQEEEEQADKGNCIPGVTIDYGDYDWAVNSAD